MASTTEIQASIESAVSEYTYMVSPLCTTILAPPSNTCSDDPTGMGASLTMNMLSVPSLMYTEAFTVEVVMLAKLMPTTVSYESNVVESPGAPAGVVPTLLSVYLLKFCAILVCIYRYRAMLIAMANPAETPDSMPDTCVST